MPRARSRRQSSVLAVALVSILVACSQGAEPASDRATGPSTGAPAGGNPLVVLNTSLGDIVLELDAAKAPITVENFLGYVDAGFFDGTIFHRVIANFMIQGGGFTETMEQKKTRPPISNESTNGLHNEAGTIAMARTSDPNSATAQFFINLKSNDFLNNGARDVGYAVFGRVVGGMDIVTKIGAVPTGNKSGMQDVPIKPVVILSAKRK